MKKKLLTCSLLLLNLTAPFVHAEDSNSSSVTTSENVASETTSSIETVLENLKQTTEVTESNLIYQNTREQSVEGNGVKIIVHDYSFVELKNFTKNLSFTFEDQTEIGYVLLIDMSFVNDTDKPAYVGLEEDVAIPTIARTYRHAPNLIDEQYALETAVNHANNYEIPANTVVRGFRAIPIQLNAAKKIEELGEATMTLSGIRSTPEISIKYDLLQSEKIILPMSKDKEAKVDFAKQFYKDRVTAENQGEKQMIEEATVGETKEVNQIKLTLDGYQIVDFLPNQDFVDRFVNFKDGVVLITAQITIKNESTDQIVRAEGTHGNLILNDNISVLNQGLLELPLNDVLLKQGDETTMHIVFAISKDDYNLYKDRSMAFKFSLIGDDFKTITNYDDYVFKVK